MRAGIKPEKLYQSVEDGTDLCMLEYTRQAMYFTETFRSEIDDVLFRLPALCKYRRNVGFHGKSGPYPA